MAVTVAGLLALILIASTSDPPAARRRWLQCTAAMRGKSVPVGQMRRRDHWRVARELAHPLG